MSVKMAYNVGERLCVRWRLELQMFKYALNMNRNINVENMHFTANAAKPVLAEVPTLDFEWVCNECNFPNLTSSVSEEEIEQELHSCINCGCFEMHKRHYR